MNKKELIDRLNKAYQHWEAFLEQIGPNRFEEPGVNGPWSIKDLISHLTVWHIHLVDRLRAASRKEGEPSPPWPSTLESEAEINAWIYQSHRERTSQEVLDEMREVYQALTEIIQSLPDDSRIEQLEGKFLVVWVGEKRFHVSEFFDHFQDDHEPDVRVWLAGKKNL